MLSIRREFLLQRLTKEAIYEVASTPGDAVELQCKTSQSLQAFYGTLRH